MTQRSRTAGDGGGSQLSGSSHLHIDNSHLGVFEPAMHPVPRDTGARCMDHP